MRSAPGESMNHAEMASSSAATSIQRFYNFRWGHEALKHWIWGFSHSFGGFPIVLGQSHIFIHI